MSQVITIQEPKPYAVPVKVCARCLRSIPFHMRSKRKKRYGGLVCARCLSSLNKQKGYAAERDFVKRLRKLGYNALRMAASGSGTEPIPDCFAYHPEKRIALAFEIKTIEGYKKWTIFAWKKDKKGKRKPSQLVKAVQFLNLMYPDVEHKAGVAIKFLLGERTKAPWVVKFIPVTTDLEKIKNVVVDISDVSDMPELSTSTNSKRSRHIVKVRRERNQSV